MKESQSGTQMWFSGGETPVRPQTYSTRVHKCLANTLQDNKHIALQALLNQRGSKKKKKRINYSSQANIQYSEHCDRAKNAVFNE